MKIFSKKKKKKNRANTPINLFWIDSVRKFLLLKTRISVFFLSENKPLEATTFKLFKSSSNILMFALGGLFLTDISVNRLNYLIQAINAKVKIFNLKLQLIID